jgi:hypothetical protein
MDIIESKEIFWGFYQGIRETIPEKQVESALQETIEKLREFFAKAVKTREKVDCILIAPRGYVDFYRTDEVFDLNTTNSYAKPTVDIECFEIHVEPALEEMSERLKLSLEKKSLSGKVKMIVYSLVPFCETK